MVLVTGVVVVLLVTGGQNAPPEIAGDLIYLEGKARPRRQQGALVASIADVTHAEVRRDADSVVFAAQTAAGLPQPLKISALQFRWDLTTKEGLMWTVTAMVQKTTEATVFSSQAFGVATVDETLPGSVTVHDNTIEVRVDVTQIPDFPTAFEWSLTTTLRAFRHEVDSPRVEDRYPDDGTEHFDE